MQQENKFVILNEVITNKATVTVDKIVTALKNGETDPVYIGVMLKKFAKVQEELYKNREARDIIESETKKFRPEKGKTFEIYGAKITIADGGFWDYSNTEDPLLEKLLEIETEVKEQIKLRKKELETKSEAWQKRNSSSNDLVNFKITPFTVTFDSLPSLEWEEAVGEIETNPPTKKGAEQLRYSV